jgi:uncharacterized RDD family membrane protein YckC
VVVLAIFAAMTFCGDSWAAETPPAEKNRAILLTGGKDFLWVAHRATRVEDKDGDKFDLLVRRPGNGKWKTLGRFSGDPAAMVTYPDRRMLVVSGRTTPSTSVFSLSDGEERVFLRGHGPGARWPLKNPPAAICQAKSLGKATSPGFLAVVPYEGDKLSTATSTSQPAPKRSGLKILQTVDGQWEPLSEINDVRRAIGARISAITSGNWVYVLVATGDKDNRLLVWNAADRNRKSTWKDIALPNAPRQPLSVNLLRERPVLVTLAPADQAGGTNLSIYELDANKIAGPPQTIKYKGQPLTLPPKSIPRNSSLGTAAEKQLVLLWWEAESYRCALVELNGNVVVNEEVTELLKALPAIDPQKISEYFFIAIPLLLLAFILFGRTKQPAGPLVLPSTFIPAPLIKRLVALIVDFLPFMVIASIIVTIMRPDLTAEDLPNLFDANQPLDIPIEMLLAGIGSTIAWIIYGTIMETRYSATLGKMLMKIEVVSGDGTPPTFRQAIMRNLIKPIELNWPIIVITMIIPIMTRTHQRLGDIMARTIVVNKTHSPVSDNQQQN